MEWDGHPSRDHLPVPWRSALRATVDCNRPKIVFHLHSASQHRWKETSALSWNDLARSRIFGCSQYTSGRFASYRERILSHLQQKAFHKLWIKSVSHKVPNHLCNSGRDSEKPCAGSRTNSDTKPAMTHCKRWKSIGTAWPGFISKHVSLFFFSRMGYERINGTCMDIDECNDLRFNVCNHPINTSQCVNTGGSYVCQCNAGFTGNGTVGYDSLTRCGFLCDGREVSWFWHLPPFVRSDASGFEISVSTSRTLTSVLQYCGNFAMKTRHEWNPVYWLVFKQRLWGCGWKVSNLKREWKIEIKLVFGSL